MTTKLVTVKLLPEEDPSESTNIENRSWILCSTARFPDDIVVGFLADHVQKSPELGRLFSDLEPSHDDEFTLELGAILPNWFPNLNGQKDYILEVEYAENQTQTIAISNQMRLIRYKFSGESVHVLVPQYKLNSLMEDSEWNIPTEAHVSVLKTMVSARFVIKGKDVEDALENNIEECIEQLVICVNTIASAHLSSEKGRQLLLLPSYDRSSFESFYLMIQGVQKDKIGAHRVVSNFTKTALRPANYDQADAELLVATVNGTVNVNDIERLMHAGKSYLGSGLLEMALLQLAMAAEIATSRFMDIMWKASGVSKTKLKDAAYDITFSQKLNIHLYAVCPPELKPDRDLVAHVDNIRKTRNKLLHEAHFSITRRDIQKMYEKTKEYVAFLEKVTSSKRLS